MKECGTDVFKTIRCAADLESCTHRDLPMVPTTVTEHTQKLGAFALLTKDYSGDGQITVGIRAGRGFQNSLSSLGLVL